MAILLTVVAVLLAVAGVVAIIQGDIIWGVLLIVLACAVGPGGWSIVGRRG